MKLVVFVVTAALIGYAVMLNGIMAHSGAPELVPIVEGTFLLGLTGVSFLTISALKSISG